MADPRSCTARHPDPPFNLAHCSLPVGHAGMHEVHSVVGSVMFAWDQSPADAVLGLAASGNRALLAERDALLFTVGKQQEALEVLQHRLEECQSERDMNAEEAERLEDALVAGDACGAVGCRALSDRTTAWTGLEAVRSWLHGPDRYVLSRLREILDAYPVPTPPAEEADRG